MSGTVLEAARELHANGEVPVRLRHRGKEPDQKDWPTIRPTEADLPRLFANGANLGLNLHLSGEADADLDYPEATRLRRWLPPTLAVFGRAGKPFSHHLYRPERPMELLQLKAPDGSMVAEIRAGAGKQTMLPPSTHPSGEAVEWHSRGAPATVAADLLTAKVKQVAAGALLARHWPVEGSRHNAALALAGALLRAGWDVEEAEQFIRDIAEAAGDEEARDRGAAAATTAQRIAEGKPATGWPGVVAIFGKPIADTVCEWLGVERRQEAPSVEVPVPTREWPRLADEALYGLAGEIVRAIDPHTEADQVATLINVLVFFGNVVGRTPHSLVSGTRHGVNEDAVLVGETARARKGTSTGYVRALFDAAEPTWAQHQIVSGLSSGEGLIYAVRDDSGATDKDGNPIRDGADDKRLLVVEEEFARPLKMADREGNILSTVLRQAWDGSPLRTLTRNSPLRADGAHISVLGHITRTELLRYLSETESANGSANRVLWLCVRRSKLLPDGGDTPSYGDIPVRLKKAITFASRLTTPITRDEDARRMWHAVYPGLTAGKPGLLGAVISRAEAHVLRLSDLYALLDCSPVVQPSHLNGALALWQYAEESAGFIFGDKLGDPIADAILERVRAAGDAGMDRTAINNLFGGNVKAGRYQAALDQLVAAGLIIVRKEATGGAPRTNYVPA